MTEGMITEFKREYTDDIKKTIIAFANTRGGEVLIGVEDDGTVIGVLDVDGTMRKATNAMRDSIKPDITMFLLCEKREMDGKDVVAVNVQKGTACPSPALIILHPKDCARRESLSSRGHPRFRPPGAPF